MASWAGGIGQGGNVNGAGVAETAVAAGDHDGARLLLLTNKTHSRAKAARIGLLLRACGNRYFG